MKAVFKWVVYLLSNIFQKKRFWRLFPTEKRNVYFFDCKEKSVFKLSVRDKVDSYTADQVFTNDDYDLLFFKKKRRID